MTVEDRKVISIKISAALMTLLGVARGIGGLALFSKNPDVLGEIPIDLPYLPALGAGLLFVSIGEIASAIGVYRGLRAFWWLGIIMTILFVIGGFINGWILFGAPRIAGTLGNLFIAALILAGLYYGRGALKIPAKQHKNRAPFI